MHQEGEQQPPGDLIDFFRRWSGFRQVAVGLAARPDLSPAERQTVHWLILLADRVGKRDLDPL